MKNKKKDLVKIVKDLIEADLTDARQKTGRDYSGQIGVILSLCIQLREDAGKGLNYLSALCHSMEYQFPDKICFLNFFNIPALVEYLARKNKESEIERLRNYSQELIKKDPDAREIFDYLL